MKHFFVTVVIVLTALSTQAQFVLKGHVTGKQNHQPIEGATIVLEGEKGATLSYITRQEGDFTFNELKKGRYKLTTSFVGMKVISLQVELKEEVTTADIELPEQSHFLEPLEIKSIRASDKAPFSKTNLLKDEIENNNLGQDLPFLLDKTPSVVVNSDAGNGIGYTGIRIRGSDATRVNVTLNGIPYNDAESQGTFFVDLPDIASSLNSIQIQRGVGTSSNGGAAFGATINLSTNELSEKAYGNFNNSYGSFNTWKHTLKAGTGLIDDHFTVDVKLSKLSSDGYIDRAATGLKSLYLSGAYVNRNSSLRFNVISGTEKTYQAWNGIEESMLKLNRRYNSSGTEKPGEPYDNETDNYQQDHYQLFFNHSVNSRLSFNTALFLTKGNGFYEQYKSGAKYSEYGLPNALVANDTITKTDLVRQLWLDNNFYGQIASLQYKTANDQITVGGGWNIYDGNHYGKIVWAQTGIPKDFKWYDLDANKEDENIYAKWQHDINNRLSLFADLQYRHVRYDIGGFRNNPGVKINRRFNFVNPKAGISYAVNSWRLFASYALGNKEPNRDDYEAGIETQPKHETLNDFEFGIAYKKRNYSFEADLYYMNYRNQLVLNGKVNDVGAYTRVNIPKSYRMGVELQGGATFAPWINMAGNLTLSENKINKYDEFIDDYDNGGQKTVSHTNKNIALSPAITGSMTLNILPVKNFTLSLPGKYVSRQYLDNTGDKSRSLNPYYVQNVMLSYTLKQLLFKQWNIIAQVNNVFNRKYEPNGYTFSYITAGEVVTENYLFPMAGTNYMLGVNVSF